MGRRALLGLAVCGLALAPAAVAKGEVVATLPPGSYFTDVSVGPTGAVWVAASGPTRGRSMLGLLGAGGVRWTTFPIIGAPLGGTSQNQVFARPDGGVWGFLGGRFAVRSTPTSFATTAVLASGEYDEDVGVSSDGGGLYISESAGSFTRVGLDGARTTVPYGAPVPEGEQFCVIRGIVPVADGTLLVDDGCKRLVRIRQDGSVAETVPLGERNVEQALAAPGGDLWIKDSSSIEHRTATRFTKVELPAFDGFVAEAAVAPDGSLWVAKQFGCGLLHVLPDGAVQELPAPLNADDVAVAPDGSVWVVDRGSLAHVVPSNAAPGACDERQPVLRLPDRSKQGTVSLRALRRHGGLRITSDEPATLIGIAVAADIKVRPQQAVDRSGTVLRLSPRLLGRLGDRVASGRRTLIKLAFVQAWDGNGNGGGFSHNVRVVP